MPNCFQLARKSKPETPVAFQEIDIEICAMLGIAVDDVKYAYGWYDSIGFDLAMGLSFDDIRKSFQHDAEEYIEDAGFYNIMIQIVDFLKENYVSDAWAEIGRR